MILLGKKTKYSSIIFMSQGLILWFSGCENILILASMKEKRKKKELIMKMDMFCLFIRHHITGTYVHL